MTHLLGGRVRHEPGSGHRSGIEPVLLAASVPARPGQIVLEGGTGSGAGLLCLARRVAIAGIGIERDSAAAALARGNAAANGFAIKVLEMDLAHAVPGPVHHAMANPPWHEASGTASPDPIHEAARRGGPGLLAAWAGWLARPLRHRGTLTMIVAAGVAAETLAAIGAVCGSLALFPLWPRAGVAAKLVLVRGVRGGRAPSRVLPGLVLHERDGAFTRQAEGVLRHGEAIEL